MNNISPIIFDKKLNAVPKKADSPKQKEVVWKHLSMNAIDVDDYIRQHTTIDDLTAEILLTKENRPRFLFTDEGMLLVLRGMNLNKNEDHEDMVPVHLWVSNGQIISFEDRPVKAIRDIATKLDKGCGPRTVGGFITMLMGLLFDRMQPIISALIQSTNDIEGQVTECPESSERQQITNIRKKAIIFRRYIAAQKDVVQILYSLKEALFNVNHKRALKECQDALIRYTEDLDVIKDRCQVIKDELSNALSDRLNHNMYILSIISAIFLPLGFLTGLLGINVGGIPGADNGAAFWVFCSILGVLVIVQLLLFRKFKWF